MNNSLSQLPAIGYNILVHLAQNPLAENMWKMLAYSDYDCLSKPNLTFAEKMQYIWREGNQEDYSVFLTPLVEDAIAESKTIVKAYSYYIHDNDKYLSSVVFAFDCLYGGNMALINYNGIPASRKDVFIHTILSVLNGADIGGIGKFTFTTDASRYNVAKATIGNERTFTGGQIFLTIKLGDVGVLSPCDD